MAWWDDYDVPDNWSETEENLYLELTGNNAEIANDETLQFLYDAALFSTELAPADRAQIYWALDEYLMDNYGIDMDETYDWESYREWYDAA